MEAGRAKAQGEGEGEEEEGEGGREGSSTPYTPSVHT